MRAKVFPALHRVLEPLFPRNCVLCDRELLWEAGRAYPICRSCEEQLPALKGSRCSVCGKPLISEQRVCMRCRNRDFGFDSAYPLWAYRGSAKDLIVAYKLRRMRSLALFFSEKLGRFLVSEHPAIPIVPVPFRKGKIRATGWDQVEDMARFLERSGLPVLRCLQRLSGPPQKILDYSARLYNLSGKIRVKSRGPVPRRILLMDDVMTTGATLSECARVLKSHGAERVDAVVLAAD